MQVSPSGMAAASQAVPGRFDSGHLLQVSIIRTICLQQANGSDYLFFHKKDGGNFQLYVIIKMPV